MCYTFVCSVIISVLFRSKIHRLHRRKIMRNVNDSSASKRQKIGPKVKSVPTTTTKTSTILLTKVKEQKNENREKKKSRMLVKFFEISDYQ